MLSPVDVLRSDIYSYLLRTKFVGREAHVVVADGEPRRAGGRTRMATQFLGAGFVHVCGQHHLL